jgi:DNA-binding PadR family transcriptional regulator
MYLDGPRGAKKEREMEHDHSFGWYHAARRGSSWGGGDFSGGGRPEWFGDWFGGPPPRAERGEVRYLVLDALAQRPRHGYEVIQAIEERSGGAYRPSPGVIYPTLQMLEELGHAELSTQEGRKVYSITDAGRRDLAEHADEVRDFYDRIPGDSWERYAEDFGDVMKRAARLFRTFKRAARHGGMSRRAQAKIREILDQAVQKIEAVLEEDERR